MGLEAVPRRRDALTAATTSQEGDPIAEKSVPRRAHVAEEFATVGRVTGIRDGHRAGPTRIPVTQPTVANSSET